MKRTPFKKPIRTPFKKPITVGSRITVTKSDRRSCECAYVGKGGKVSEVYDDGTCRLILDCGHTHVIPITYIARSTKDVCVNCRKLIPRSKMRVPSFWRGGGLLCDECWVELEIDKHEKLEKERCQTRKRSKR